MDKKLITYHFSKSGLLLYFVFVLLFIYACGAESVTNIPSIDNEKQTITEDNGLKGDLDPFEFITNPQYVALSEVDLLNDEDLVLVYKANSGQYYIYPHRSLLVEVVNDEIEGKALAINFCPLTGSGMAWNRIFDGDTSLLTASGMLFRDNLVVWDSITGDLWSQMRMTSFKESSIDPIETLALVQTDWAKAKKIFRGAKVFVHACDFICSARDYEPGNSDFSKYSDSDLVYGILSPLKDIATYILSDFGQDFTLDYPNLPGPGIVVAGSQEYNMIVAFESNENFEPLMNKFPLIMKDQWGSEWDLFGQALNGPRKGERLKAAKSYYAYARAWEQVWND